MNTPITPKPCQNTFLEEDGYCTKCGENHFQKRDGTKGKRGKSNARFAPKHHTPRPIKMYANEDEEMAAEVVIEMDGLWLH